MVVAKLKLSLRAIQSLNARQNNFDFAFLIKNDDLQQKFAVEDCGNVG